MKMPIKKILAGSRLSSLAAPFVVAMLIGTTACAENEQGGSSIIVTDTTQIEVFKSPSCGCCGKWIDHLEESGFSATVQNSQNLNAIKTKHSIAPRYQSCHTAIVDGYVLPANVIQQFLTEKPANAIGLAVPGMPIGSPGMEMGDRHDDYDVLLLKGDGSSEVYTHISAPMRAQN